MRPASEKQIAFAKDISECLHIPLPTVDSAYLYWKFINEHFKAFSDYVSNDPAFDDDYQDMFPEEWRYDGGL